jgi:hypothetical protein
MTLPRIVPSADSAEWLTDLIADASAIPAAAFAPCETSPVAAIDLTALPRQRSAIRIPEAGVSFAVAAEHCF